MTGHYVSRFTLYACYLIPILFLLLFYFYPLLAIFGLSFAPEGQFDLAALQKLISSAYYLKTIWFTLWQAMLSTLLTLILAMPGAYVFARYRFPGQEFLRALTTIPFVLPTIVVANAFTALFGPRGLVNEGLMALLQLGEPPIQFQHSIGLILLAHIFYNYTLVIRLVGGFWANLNPELVEAGQMLGASPWRAFWHITLPLLGPVVAAAALLIFIFSFTSFGVVLILGGPRFATIEVEIYRQAVNLFNLPIAGALSLIQIIFIFVLMVSYTRLQARLSRPLHLQSRQSAQRIPRRWRDHLIVWGNIGLMLILLGAPLAALVGRSLFVAGRLSLAYYQALFSASHQSQTIFFVPPGEGIVNSLVFALSTVGLSIFLGLLVTIALTGHPDRFNNLSKPDQPASRAVQPLTSKRLSETSWGRLSSLLEQPFQAAPHSAFQTVSKVSALRLRPRVASPKSLFDTLFMLPLATSAVTLGFGYIIALNKPPLNLRTSPALIVIAHTLVALPLVIRSLLPAVRSIQPVLREAAAVLGASPFRVWREIDLPIAGRALLVGAVFAFTISMGEFGATVFIARPDTPTMPLAIFRLLDQPGALNYGQALAMSALLIFVCLVGFVLIERFRIGGAEF
jgi:thiamine transport system permease protein